MAKNYRDINYFESRPDIVKIFDDLEAFKDYCCMEMNPFNEADLYNNRSWVWRNFQDKINGRKPYKKPYQGNKPRYENRNNGERFSR
jgi:hypothetical protein